MAMVKRIDDDHVIPSCSAHARHQRLFEKSRNAKTDGEVGAGHAKFRESLHHRKIAAGLATGNLTPRKFGRENLRCITNKTH